MCLEKLLSLIRREDFLDKGDSIQVTSILHVSLSNASGGDGDFGLYEEEFLVGRASVEEETSSPAVGFGYKAKTCMRPYDRKSRIKELGAFD